MNTLLLPSYREHGLIRSESQSDLDKPPARKSRLLVFTADEPFWQKLLSAASGIARKLVRRRNTNDTARTVRLLKPGAVLLDLDIPAPSPWATADSLLQDTNVPPLLLLTSRSGQLDFRTAIEAGYLLDKGADPASVLELAELALDSPEPRRRQRDAMLQSVIRWLKPCTWATYAPLRRFWGINE